MWAINRQPAHPDLLAARAPAVAKHDLNGRLIQHRQADACPSPSESPFLTSLRDPYGAISAPKP
jgi:hypothetical protein